MSAKETRKEAKKSRGHVLDNLLADPWRKLLAFGLAVLLWLFLNSRIVQEDSLDFRLQAVDVAAGSTDRDEELRITLAVRLPLHDWTVRGYYEMLNTKSIDKVQLHFEGPRYMIARLRQQNPGFEVTPSASDFRERGFDFDIGDVHSRNADFAGLLTRMEPRIIRVELERNRREPIPLIQQKVEVLVPDTQQAPDFKQRLSNSRVDFQPPTVTLFGPQDALASVLKHEKLFEVELSEPTNGEDIPPARLRLLSQHLQMGVQMDPDIAYAVYRLAPQFRAFTMSVPVTLHVAEIPGVTVGEFVVEPTMVTIQLKASKQLEAELTLKEEQKELDAWARANLVLLASVRPGPDLAELHVSPTLYCINKSYKEGVDWQIVELAPPVKITRRPQ